MRRLAAASGQTARHECRIVCGEAGVEGRVDSGVERPPARQLGDLLVL